MVRTCSYIYNNIPESPQMLEPQVTNNVVGFHRGLRKGVVVLDTHEIFHPQGVTFECGVRLTGFLDKLLESFK